MTASIPRILEPTPTHGGAPSHSPPDTRYVPGHSAARALGYFSIGLGLAELLAPQSVARLTGVRQHGLLRAYGLRELAAGLGILSSTRPVGWLWSRVAGDVLDLATLGGNLATAHDGRRERTLAATVAVAGVTLLDLLGAAQESAAAALTDD